MDKLTLNYVRLRWSKKMPSNMLWKPEFVPLYRGLARVTPRKYRRLRRKNMVTTAQEVV